MVQTSPRNFSGGAYTFNFEYTAPNNPGNIIIYATGMSSKRQWNFSQNFELAVGGTILQSEISLNEGWNIISVPLLAADMSVNEIFPDAITAAFGFDGTYQTATILENSKGYWIKYATTDNINISGTGASGNIEINEGWNLIGPYNIDISVNAISSSPANIITSQFFTYAGGYNASTTLEHGKGYWVNASSSGELILNGRGHSISKTIEPEVSEKLVFMDADGNTSSLFFTKQSTDDEYILPPLPPNGVFDVRFGDDKYVSKDGSSGIILSGVKYPLIITSSIEMVITESLSGSMLGKGKSVTINKIESGRININYGEKPASFSLEQNYPNPFNPETNINFNLQYEGVVTLTIYSIPGEKITTLVSGKLNAGKHHMSWNGKDLAGNRVSAGIYIYKLESGKNTLSKKMILLK